MSELARSFYPLLENPFGYRLFIWMLNHLPFLIPVERLRETDTLLAFFHPRRAHAFHVLLIPKQALRNLAELDPGSPFLSDVVMTSQSIVEEFRLPAYRLVVNGGQYQEFPHLHFHLISDAQLPPPAEENQHTTQ